jgi:hypothetical protein
MNPNDYRYISLNEIEQRNNAEDEEILLIEDDFGTNYRKPLINSKESGVRDGEDFDDNSSSNSDLEILEPEDSPYNRPPQQRNKKDSKKALKIIGFLFQNLFIDIICPIIIFFSLQNSIGATLAIVLSAIPPAVSTIFSIVVFKRIEAIPIISLCSISITSIFTLSYGNPKFNLLPDAIIPLFIGVGFLFTIKRKRPLFYYFARPWVTQNNPEKIVEWNNKWDQAGFRRDMRLIGVGWGIGLLLRGLSWGILVYFLEVQVLLIINPIIGLGFMVPLGVWTSVYVKKKLAQFRLA